jgi:hypothetical protein
MKGVLIKKDKEIELLRKESDSEVSALKSKLHVRGISMYKLILTLNSGNFKF